MDKVKLELLRSITYGVCLITIGLCIGALFRAEAVQSQCEYECNSYICEKYDESICPIGDKINENFNLINENGEKRIDQGKS